MRWLPWLLAVDLVLIGLDGALRLGVHMHLIAAAPPFLNVSQDNSLPEAWDYLKYVVIVGSLGLAFRATRAPVFAAFALTFLLILADDSLRLHETFGRNFARSTGETRWGPVRMQDAGELLVWSGLGAVAAALLGAGFRASDRAARRLAAPLLGALFLMLACAIGLDLLFVAIYPRGKFAILASLMEDGGEMLAITLACAYVAALTSAVRGSTTGPPATPGAPEADILRR